MKKALLRSIGIGIFAYLLIYVIDISELAKVLRSFNLWVLVYVLPFHFSLWTLRVLRWKILLKNEDIDLPFFDILAIAASGFFLGCMTPGRLGEFAKVKFLMNAGHPFRGAFMSSLLERFLDLAALFFYVVFAVVVCWDVLPDALLFYLLIAMLGITGLLTAYIQRRRIKNIILQLIPETVSGNVEEKLSILSYSINATRGNQRLVLLGYSIAMWGLNHIIIYLLFHGAGYTLPIYYTFAFSTLGSLASLIPISIYGVGIRESIMIAMLPLVGYTPADAKTAGFMFGFMFVILLIYHTLWGFIWWMSPIMQRYFAKDSTS
jgi:glycosyltransferase 2 family protein